MLKCQRFMISYPFLHYHFLCMIKHVIFPFYKNAHNSLKNEPFSPRFLPVFAMKFAYYSPLFAGEYE